MGQHKLPADHPTRAAGRERYERLRSQDYVAASPTKNGQRVVQVSKKGRKLLHRVFRPFPRKRLLLELEQKKEKEQTDVT